MDIKTEVQKILNNYEFEQRTTNAYRLNEIGTERRINVSKTGAGWFAIAMLDDEDFNFSLKGQLMDQVIAIVEQNNGTSEERKLQKALGDLGMKLTLPQVILLKNRLEKYTVPTLMEEYEADPEEDREPLVAFIARWFEYSQEKLYDFLVEDDEIGEVLESVPYWSKSIGYLLERLDNPEITGFTVERLEKLGCSFEQFLIAITDFFTVHGRAVYKDLMNENHYIVSVPTWTNSAGWGGGVEGTTVDADELATTLTTMFEKDHIDARVLGSAGGGIDVFVSVSVR